MGWLTDFLFRIRVLSVLDPEKRQHRATEFMSKHPVVTYTEAVGKEHRPLPGRVEKEDDDV